VQERELEVWQLQRREHDLAEHIARAGNDDALAERAAIRLAGAAQSDRAHSFWAEI
jgi:hypothetical protein